MLQEFLDKEEYRKYKIIQMIERNAGRATRKEKILEGIEVSNLVYGRLIDAIILDLEKFGLSKSMTLIVYANELFVETDGTVSSETILEKYIQQSIKYRLFCTAFSQKFRSLNEFSLFYSISYPIAHKNLKELNQQLAKRQITLNKKFQIEGKNERELRLFVLELFNRVERKKFTLYPIRDVLFIQQQLEKVILYSNKKAFEGILVYQDRKTKHYLYIIETRIRQGFIIQTREDFLEREQIALHSLWYPHASNFYTRFLLKSIDMNSEAATLALFYETYYSNENYSLTKQLYPYIERGYAVLYAHFVQEIQEIAHCNNEMNIFEKEIVSIHAYLSGVSIEHDLFITGLDPIYFAEAYPRVFNFCLNHINRLEKEIPELYRHRKVLLWSYILIILNTFPKYILMETVNIHVNFTLGAAYNQFIIEGLSRFSQTEAIKITNFELADIVLTNYRDFDSHDEKEYIVWLLPPRPIEWASLGQLITNVRAKKAR